MQLNTNVASLNAVRQLNGSNALLGTTFQRLSSGLRINSAKDDAAGLQISNRLTAQIGGLGVAMRNANDGISMLQTAEGAMQAVTDNLQRMRDLSVAAANGALGSPERSALQAEVAALAAEITRINDTTTFGGKALFAPGSTASFVDLNIRAVVAGLKGVWLEESEARIERFFGIKGDGATLTVDLTFTDGAGNTAASVSGTVGGDGRTENMELNIDMADFVPPNLPNGGNAPFYNDRIIAHEMVHAIMGRSVDMTAQPDWFLEGTAEFIHGAEERVAGDTANGTNVAALLAAFNADDVSGSQGYSAGYSAVRYMHERIQGAGGEGIKDILEYLAANLGADLSTALANASSGAFTDLTDFENDFNADAATFIAAFNFANTDTGAVGGFDVDGGEVYTAKSVMPNAGTRGARDNPLRNFNVVFPDIPSAGAGGQVAQFQVGAQANETIVASINGISAGNLGIADLNVVDNPQFSIMFIDDALTQIDTQRGRLGAVMNRLQSTIANLDSVRENVSASRSRIRDTDFAVETAQLTKGQVMQQAGLAVLQQANANPNVVLSLLRA